MAYRVPAEKRCQGETGEGKPCRAAKAHGTEFCHHHQNQSPDHVPKEAEVLSISEQRKARRQDYSSGRMTRDEYLDWLQEIMMGDITETRTTSGGDVYQAEASISDKRGAGREYRQLMKWKDDADAEGSFRRAVEDVVDDILG